MRGARNSVTFKVGVVGDQGDQMSYQKNGPKCSPTCLFLAKLMHNHKPAESSPQSQGYFCNFPQNWPNKQSPNGRKNGPIWSPCRRLCLSSAVSQLGFIATFLQRLLSDGFGSRPLNLGSRKVRWLIEISSRKVRWFIGIGSRKYLEDKLSFQNLLTSFALNYALRMRTNKTYDVSKKLPLTIL
jgi:hypothetical protein